MTAAAFSRKITANADEDVSRSTASRRLNEFRLTARSLASKKLISKTNRNARFGYAEAYVV